jgi:hypothetical protein
VSIWLWQEEQVRLLPAAEKQLPTRLMQSQACLGTLTKTNKRFQPPPPTFIYWKSKNKMTWVSCLNFNTGPKNTVNNNKIAIKRQGVRTETCYNIPLSSIYVGRLCFEF